MAYGVVIRCAAASTHRHGLATVELSWPHPVPACSMLNRAAIPATARHYAPVLPRDRGAVVVGAGCDEQQQQRLPPRAALQLPRQQRLRHGRLTHGAAQRGGGAVRHPAQQPLRLAVAQCIELGPWGRRRGRWFRCGFLCGMVQIRGASWACLLRVSAGMVAGRVLLMCATSSPAGVRAGLRCCTRAADHSRHPSPASSPAAS